VIIEEELVCTIVGVIIDEEELVCTIVGVIIGGPEVSIQHLDLIWLTVVVLVAVLLSLYTLRAGFSSKPPQYYQRGFLSDEGMTYLVNALKSEGAGGTASTTTTTLNFEELELGPDSW
jgi:hypothetical protein